MPCCGVRVGTEMHCQGAPDDVWKGIKGDKEDLEEEIGNALEVLRLSCPTKSRH